MIKGLYRSLFLGFIFSSMQTLLALPHLWFTGYAYKAQQLLPRHYNDHVLKSNSIDSLVDAINCCYLHQEFDTMNVVFDRAIELAKLQQNKDLLYGIYNLHVERNHFAGRYLYAEKSLKRYLKIVPVEHMVWPFLRLNRIKLLAKSFPLQGGLLPQSELDELINRFSRIKAYRALIETKIFDYSKNVMLADLNQYVAYMKKLPNPYDQIGLMNLYYQSKFELRDVAILNQVSTIPDQLYLDFFRFHIAKATEYINVKDSTNASKELRLSFPKIAELGDIEVSRHYTGVYQDFVIRFDGLPFAPKPLINLRDYDHEGRLLASNDVAKELLNESNSKLQMEKDINWYFRIVLIFIVVALSVLLAFYLRAHIKLKQANIMREWFVTALSHDLRSPLSQIANSIDNQADRTESKRLLVQFEYLLNDTLEMAIDAKKNKPLQFDVIDVVELLDATLLDLDFIFKQMGLNVQSSLPNDCLVKGNANGLKVLFRNVLLNATKHNYQSGSIQISVSSHPTKRIVINNTVKSNVSLVQEGTGTQLINYFAAQNEVRYHLSIHEGEASVELIFKD